MFTFEGHCPHCHSDRGFHAFGASEYLIGEYDYSKTPFQEAQVLQKRRENNPNTFFSLCGSCIACKKPVVATCEASLKILTEIRECIADIDRAYKGKATIKTIFPEPTVLYTHPSLPEDVRNAFVDLQKMLQARLQPHFILAGCRTVLEAVVRELGGNGHTLSARIADLHAQGVITKGLADWAHQIRIGGNDAVHEMSGTPEEARELVEFTKLFLQFTFELPARINEVRTSRT